MAAKIGLQLKNFHSCYGIERSLTRMEHQFAFLLFEISLVLTAAKIGGLLARSVHLPVVLGELFAGVVLGNMTLVGISLFEWVRTDSSLAMLAELGVIILMFEVGLDSHYSYQEPRQALSCSRDLFTDHSQFSPVPWRGQDDRKDFCFLEP